MDTIRRKNSAKLVESLNSFRKGKEVVFNGLKSGATKTGRWMVKHPLVTIGFMIAYVLTVSTAQLIANAIALAF